MAKRYSSVALLRKLRRCVPVALAAALLFADFSAADLIIKLKDGQDIIVPVENDNIESIVFAESNVAIGDYRRSNDGGGADRGGSANAPALVEAVSGQTLRVGPGQEFRNPSEAARKAKNGDTIEILAGTYYNDYSHWRQDDITIRGVGGLAHLTSKGIIRNGKGIWIISGNNVTIENMEFSGAAVRDTNGAGIRHQGGNLLIRNSFFHDNEFSILTPRLQNAEITVESSRFWFQKRKKRFSHGIYIGKVRKFTLIGSHFKGTDQGHQVKTRALENQILYNRIEDVPNGNSSRLIDLSNCGLSFIIGNDLHQARTTENSTAIGYGPERCEDRTPTQKQLYVVNNTFINEARAGLLVHNYADGEVIIANNLVYGRGDFLDGRGMVNDNLQLPLDRAPEPMFATPNNPEVRDKAKPLPPIFGVSPIKEFDPPVGIRDRPQLGGLDLGSREISP